MKSFPKPLDNNALKLIALFSMIIDHSCLVLFPHSWTAYMLRITVGRLAMPIYVYLICEGFYYTRSRFRYGRNLLLFALISEPIYDLACFRTPFYPADQNIFFTLFFGLLLLCILNKLALLNKQIFQLPVIALFCFLSVFLHLDYSYSAVIMFALLYYLHWRPVFVKGFSICTVLALVYNVPAVYFTLIPLLLYNEKRGAVKPLLKYLFYIIYPAHLLLLLLIRIFFF